MTRALRSPRTAALALVTVAATVLVMALAGCGRPAGPPPVVVVGVDVDLAGPGAAYERALRLVIEQVNGRELAGAGRRMALRVLDNRADAAVSARNLSVLAADPRVVGVVTAGCDQCVIDTAGSLSVPVIALSATEAVAAPPAQRRWVFRLGPNAADDADVLSAAMAADGVQTVAVVYADDPYGRDGMRWFEEAAARDGLEVTGTVRLPGAATAAQVADAAEAASRDRPDAVLLWTYAPQAAAVGQALHAAGHRGEVYVDMVGADELFGPGPLAGARLVATPTAVAAEHVAASPAAAARQEWVLAYVSRYGGYQMPSTWAADALLVLADAVARAGGTDRDAVRTRVESTRIDGMTGPIRFTAEQHSGLLPGALVVLTATGDRWQ